MAHSVAEQAARSVKKSEKMKLLERTPEQIIKDIRMNLNAKLAVTPDDVRFLLKRFDETYAALQECAPTIAETPLEEFKATLGDGTVVEEAKTEFHVVVPKHVGDTVRIISEVGPVNVVGDVKETNAQKS